MARSIVSYASHNCWVGAHRSWHVPNGVEGVERTFENTLRRLRTVAAAAEQHAAERESAAAAAASNAGVAAEAAAALRSAVRS